MIESHPKLLPDGHNSDELLAALESVLASNAFAEVFRLKKFLEYSVRETVAGRGDRLKGFVIACEVFDKKDPSDAQTTTVVRVEAGRLRRRLKDYYENEGRNDPVRISMPKGGYSASFSMAGKSAANGPTPESAAGRKPLHHNPLTWIAALAVLVLLYFSLPLMKGPGATGDPVALPDTHPTIAVMPFENLTGEAGGDALATGLTEDIVIDLGAISTIDVISVSSVLPFKDNRVTPGEIGDELGASYVLRGSVRELSPRLRLSAQLYEAGTGRQLWAERLESMTGDTLAMQEGLARRVVSSLSISLKNEDERVFGREFTENKEAWQLYKQSLNLVNPPSDPARLELARGAFEQIIDMDPEFAGGYAGSAYTRSFLVFFGHSENPEQDRQAAMEMATKAREIDPTFGLTFSALAFIYLSNGQFQDALSVSDEAVKVHPNDPYVSAYHGFILGANGDLEGGMPYVERALRLDPLNARSPYLNILGVLSYFAGEYEQSRLSFLNNRERGGPYGAGSIRFLAAVYSRLGERARAESILKEADGLDPAEDKWRQWLLGTFADPEIPHRVIDEVERIRETAGSLQAGDSSGSSE
jgi:TolB-like protein